jgi:glycosyltransferase 2 family protein
VSRLPRWRAVAGLLLVAAAGIFLAATVARQWRQIEAFDWDLRWAALAASTVVLTAVLAWGVVVWKLVLDRFEHPPVPLSALLEIWFLSNLARYVPGKIWQFVGAAELARIAGLSRVVVLTSMVVHVGFSLLAAAVLSVLVLGPMGAPEGVSTLALGAVAGSSLLLVHPAVLNAALGLVARVFRRPVVRWAGRWRDGLLLLVLSVLSWILYGGAFALFVHSVIRIGPSAVLPLAGVNALSFLVGYLVFLAPAGLGAREGVMAVLLRPFAPAAVAAVVAVLSRLWTVAAELLGAAIVLGLRRRRDARSRAAERPGVGSDGGFGA